MAPGWALLPLVALATTATVIASQALISGAYSITMQTIQLGHLPRAKIDHTSPREFGQVYLPAVNVALMVACIGLVLAFRSSTALAAAYGIAVTSTMIITTILLLLVVARERWRWPIPAIVGIGAVFLTLDVAFLGANVVTIPAGGWLPLLIGAIIFAIMTTWHGGRAHTAARRRLGARELTAFVTEVETTPRTAGTAIYLGAEPGHVPTALRRAFAHVDDLDLAHAVDVLGRETIVANPAIPGMRLWREKLFALLHRNASSAVRYFRLPRDRIIEVGSIIEI